MNTKPLTLSEATNLLNTLPLQEAMNHESLNAFVASVESAGKDILLAKGGADTIEEASGFLLAAVMAECLTRTDVFHMQLFQAMEHDPEIFQLLFGYVFVYSVGIAAVEELR